MARLGVRKDITSHITWHVLGILAKTRKDWPEASKAFAMARRQDPDNIPVLRDAIALATHTRNFPLAIEARHHYLLLRPQIRSSWLGLMIAHELHGDYEEALAVYDDFTNTLSKDGGTAPERAQILLHVIKMCIAAGKFQSGLDRLEKGIADGTISPRGEVSEIKAQLLVELGRKQEAEDAYRVLLEQNSDNISYYGGFLRTLGYDIAQALDASALDHVLKQLDGLAETYPRSSAPRRLALDVAHGQEFKERARDYIVRGLERGVPSLFVDVKGVYRDTAKLLAVGEILDDLISKLESETSLHGDDSIPPPTTLLWAYYFKALHHAHRLNPQPDYAKALDLIEVALKHTPTLPEIYMAKAMVLKRAGDVQGAAEAMEDARLLDGQDRFLNSKAAKYWLRADNIEKAEELLAMFTKKDVTATQDLTDMQCLWFLTEEGDAHNRTANLGMALKRYQALVTVFQEYEDDQYDFHSYCMRRMTFSAYVQLMKYEDSVRVHPAFLHSALAAIDIYLRISDDPELTVEHLTPEQEAERKKAAKKAQKAEQKARKAAAASGDKKDEAPPPDEDPRGEKLLKTETPLDDALKLWARLEKNHASRIETWLAGFELHLRKEEYLLALRDLREAAAIDKNGAGLLPALVQFRAAVQRAQLSEPVKKVIDEVLPSLISDADVATLVKESLTANPKSAAHIAAAAKALKVSDAPAPEIKAILEQLAGLEHADLAVMRRSLQLLPAAEQKELKAVFHKAFPLAFVFATDEEKAQRVKQPESTSVDGKADV